MSLDTKMLDLK